MKIKKKYEILALGYQSFKKNQQKCNKNYKKKFFFFLPCEIFVMCILHTNPHCCC